MVIIDPEVLKAGVDVYDECRKRKLSRAEICVAIFIAMQEALRCLEAVAQSKQETVH
jgi:hypothetical protein